MEDTLKDYTTFTSSRGLKEINVMPFGMVNSCFTLQPNKEIFWHNIKIVVQISCWDIYVKWAEINVMISRAFFKK